MAITIERTTKHITVKSDYNIYFIAAARNLAGKFDKINQSWVFDIRDESDVLEACFLAYGEDGVQKDQCDVKITIEKSYYADKDAIHFLGRPIARAFGRDSGAKVYGGVIIKQGGFDSGGSAKNWTTKALPNTTIVLRDVSHPLALHEQKKLLENGIKIEILLDKNKQKLIEEKERLLARLAEINAELEE